MKLKLGQMTWLGPGWKRSISNRLWEFCNQKEAGHFSLATELE